MPFIPIPNIAPEKISLDLLSKKNVEASVLRLDKVHPVISGNKWFKLRYYFEDAIRQNKKTIVTFGGAWSNHIVATAAASKEIGINSLGIIRGEETVDLSPTLRQAKEFGMELIFISREDYRRKKIPIQLNESDHYIINEGGYGVKGAEGAATILDAVDFQSYTHICCAVGTGTMIAGLTNRTATLQKTIGISVLKNNVSLNGKIRELLINEEKSFQIIHDYHFAGYAKHTVELITSMNEFYRQTNIPSDFVYTGKLFYGVIDLIRNNFFLSGSKLLVIHSGGLQGNASLKEGKLIF